MEKQSIDLLELSDPDWYVGNLPRQIWLTCYSAMLLTPDDLQQSIIVLHRAKLIILYGDLPYIHTANLTVRNSLEGIQIENKIDSLWKNTGEGWWMLLVQPYQVPAGTDDRRSIVERRDEILGLVSAVSGRNLCYEKAFEYALNLQTKEYGAFTRFIRMPASMPKPIIDKATLAEMANIDSSIVKLGVASVNRYRLALRWYYRASEPTGVDAYLYYWVALEVIAMEDTTNIAPLVDLLAKGYAQSDQWVRDTFHIGRLQGLRSKIVHNGLDVPIESALLDFLDALFIDVLTLSIGMRCPMKALDFMKSRHLSLLDVIPQ